MTPGPRRRGWLITVALVGLVALVVIGWLVTSGEADRGSGVDTRTAVLGSATRSPVSAVPAPDTTRSVATAPVVTAPAGMAVRALSALPAETARVWRLIQDGGPFRYDQDGATFGNRERLLPIKRDGYYHEYTVPTPGESDRGARRLVTGRGGELYYTGDHYESFVLVDVNG